MHLTHDIHIPLTEPLPVSDDGQEIMEKYIQETRLQARFQPLPVGTPAPDFSLTSPDDEVITDLDSILEFAPLVMVFFQGRWNTSDLIYLQELDKALPKIKALGGKLVAISPESPYRNAHTAIDKLLDFPVLTDTHNELAKKFGLVFPAPLPQQLNQRRIVNNYSQRTHELHELHELQELSWPATYVIGRNKKVAYSFVPDDFMERAPVRSILTAVYHAR